VAGGCQPLGHPDAGADVHPEPKGLTHRLPTGLTLSSATRSAP
jgi:hypothetical protein